MKKNVIIFILAFCTSSVFCQAIFNVVNYGARGDGITDDRAAIQSAINAASITGGTVYFPAGIYVVSPVYSTNPRQIICIDIADNIAIEGEDKNTTIIKLIDNAGNFDAVIGNFPSSAVVNNVIIRNITIDGNSSNNQVTNLVDLAQSSRSLVRVFLGSNYLIENCIFTNSQGVWNVVFNGLVENIIIRNNIFKNIGSSTLDWDHSTIYTNGNNFIIEDNIFTSLNGPGTLGARTAIEIHGSNQIVRRNFIDGFCYGVNVTGYSNFYFSRDQYYYDNTIINVIHGFILWSGVLDDPLYANGLENVYIFNNSIRINNQDWFDWQFFNGGGGVVFWSDNDRDTDSLFIFHNIIEFTGAALASTSESRYSTGLRAGVNINPNPVKNKNLYFNYNRIVGPESAGIYLERYFENLFISSNILENVGRNSGNLFNGFRSGIFTNDTLKSTYIQCNTLVETDGQNTKYLLYHNGHLSGESYFLNNVNLVPTAFTFQAGNDSSGLPWATSDLRPKISFAEDTVTINGNSGQVLLLVNNTIHNSITVKLQPIYVNNNYGNTWQIPTEVIFNPGETQKIVQINNLLGVSSANETHYVQILLDSSYAPGCNNLLKIILEPQPLHTDGSQLNDKKSILVYPNPTTDLLTLCHSGFRDVESITICNIFGVVVKRYIVDKTQECQILKINDLPAGTYFLIYGAITVKIVKL